MHIVATVNAAWNMWNFRRELLQSLLEDGHRITIVAPPDGSVNALQALGCDFVPLQMDRSGINPLQEFILLRRFRQIFRSAQPDLILGFTIKNNIFGAIAARKLGIPFIPNVTGLGTAFLSGNGVRGLAHALYRFAFSQCSIVFFQNVDDRSHFLKQGIVRADQAKLVPGSGIDLDRFAAAPYPDENQPLTFLMMARLLRDKGVVEYVTAASHVREVHPHTRFRLVGASGAQNRTAITRQEVAEWERAGHIEYAGQVDDVRSEIAQSHCVVLPSYREGAPRTLIEAAAMARPLIATDVAGCKSVIDDEETGLLCAPRDARSLADCMLAFISVSSEKQSEMGLLGRRKMQREYDVHFVIRSYREAIASLTPSGQA